MAKDRSKQILREIRSLRKELSERLDQLEARAYGPASIESPAAPAASPASVSGNVSSADLQDGSVHPDERPAAESASPVPAAVPEGKISVVVQPLHDLSLARVVEDALARTEGLSDVTLRELRGDSATIDTNVAEGVSLVTSLRRKLPVAFDVTESSSDSVTIALAQPTGEREGGVAAPSGS